MVNADNHQIVEAALGARSTDEADAVQQLITQAIGARYQRPLGDTWNNHGILTASGSSYDHKVLEAVTNMQDAVLELRAIQKYGSRQAVPFATPQDAAAGLLEGLDRRQQADLASVTIDRAEPGSNKKRVTLTMRDRGCGIAAVDVPRGIFRVGAKHKDGIDWQQGTFGLGGATTYRNARAVVLVTRRHPDLLEGGQDDKITVAVVQWERQRTTTNAFYLVTRPWDEDDPSTWVAATPFSVPAVDFPDFGPGTHLALIGYDTEGLGRRSGDEKSFDTVLNTRLYRPVTPVQYRNNITRSDRVETLDGLQRRLNDNPGEPGTEGIDTLPFNHNGTTYQLPIRFRIFAKPGSMGERRKFVAQGHALLITSNGQVHYHWTPQDFKNKTKLNKLFNRVLVVVESDALPIEVRTELFTADRAQLVRTAPAMRLESEIVAFLDDWAALRDANNALIREAITGDNNDRPTIAIAEKIARALKVKGFSTSGMGTGGGGPKPPSPTPHEDLYDDPTHFEGPEAIEAAIGKAKGVYFKLNAKDGFLGPRGRAQLIVSCDHPDIGPSEITVGELRSGRVRVSLAIPEGADLGPYGIKAEIPQWPKSSGGLGPEFVWTTTIEIVDATTPKDAGTSAGKDKGKRGLGEGNLVALIWKSDAEDAMDGWSSGTVGEIEMVAARELAERREEYKELAKFDAEIPTIVLNRTYSPLKAYVQARAAELTEEGKEQSRERYAVGVGVALLLLYQQQIKKEKAGEVPDEGALKAGQDAAARAVLAVMPDYDRLAKELED